jgi:hypothetical protein
MKTHLIIGGLALISIAHPSLAETQRFSAPKPAVDWYVTDERYGSNTDGSLMMAGTSDFGETHDVPLYFFCKYPDVTMHFQPPTKYIGAVQPWTKPKPASGSQYYEYTLYADGGAYNVYYHRLPVLVGAHEGGRAGRADLTDYAINILRRTNGRVTIGYGVFNANNNKWSESAGYTAASITPAFNYLLTQCMDRANKHVMPPPPRG